MGPAKSLSVLDYFSTWNSVQRQQRKLFRALAQWQCAPGRDLGSFGLSVTTEVTNPRSNAITLQFTLHHEAGGQHESGIVTLDCDPNQGDIDWLPGVASPLLSEFLLPSAIASEFRAYVEPTTPLRVVTA